MECQTSSPSTITLSKEPSSPVRNSSIIAGRSADGGAMSSHTFRSPASSRRKVLFAPDPAGGLTTSGKPVGWLGGDQRQPGTGHAGGRLGETRRRGQHVRCDERGHDHGGNVLLRGDGRLVGAAAARLACLT